MSLAQRRTPQPWPATGEDKDDEQHVIIARRESSATGRTTQPVSHATLGKKTTIRTHQTYPAREPDPTIQPFILGGGIIDPFLATPVALDHVGKELIANIFHADDQRPHRNDWFTVGLADQATFHQVLANSALHLYGLHSSDGGGSAREGGKGVRVSKLATMYHQLAVTSVRKRLQRIQHEDRRAAREKSAGEGNLEREKTIDALIGCVSGMICFTDIVASAELWHMHRKGLVQLVQLYRGGLEALDNHLRAAVSWVELRGAYMHDTRPHFPLPKPWLESCDTDRRRSRDSETSRPTYIVQLRIAWFAIRDTPTHNYLANSPPWLSVLEDLTLLCPLADADLARTPVGSGLENLRDLPLWTNVLIHRLISLTHQMHAPSSGRGEQAITGSAAALAEASRISMLLFLAPIWRAYGVKPAPTQTLVRKQYDLLRRTPQLWRMALSEPALGRLFLWILCVSTLEAIDLDDSGGHGDDGLEVEGGREQPAQDWFTQTLLRVAALTGTPLRNATDIETVMKGVVWAREVFDKKVRTLGRELERRTEEVGPRAE